MISYMGLILLISGISDSFASQDFTVRIKCKQLVQSFDLCQYHGTDSVA